MRSKLQSKWPYLVIVVAILILFWPTLIWPFSFLYPTFSPFSDTMVIHWPKANLMAQQWQNGDGLPLWTPLILSGMPMAANQLAMLFYPPAWLFLLLPIEPVFNILFVFHLAVGGVGIYLLLRHIHQLSPLAAVLGALTFTLNGKWLAHAAGGHVSMVGAIGWMPWVVFGTMQLLRATSLATRLKWSVVVGIVLALQITTHTLPFIYSIYLIGAIVIWHLLFLAPRRWEAVKQLWLPILGIPILAGLLGAIQLWPLLELTQFSNRALSLQEAAAYSVTVTQLLVGLLLPSAQGGHEYVIYVGLLPLLLAPFGVSRQNRWTWFYALLFVFTILFALGPSTPIHAFFYYAAPGFGWVRTPARMFFVGAIAVSALTGFAADRLQQRRWSPQASRKLTRLAIIVGTVALMIGVGLALGFGIAQRSAFALAIIIPAGVTVILLRVKRVISGSTALILLGLILVIDLAGFDSSIMKFVSRQEALSPGQDTAAYMSEKPGIFRTYSPSYSLPMQTAAHANLHLADGVEPVHLAVYDEYMARAGGYDNPGFSVTIPNFGNGELDTALKNTKPNLNLLGMLNVVYLVSEFPMNWPGLTLDTQLGNAHIYKNAHALPRAWVAHQTTPIESDWLTQLETLPNLENVVLLTKDVDNTYPKITPTDQVASPVVITNYTANRIDLETEITTAGWLVVSEIWYPGWAATINGVPQPVEEVNGLLRGIYLNDSGQYHITLSYQPQSIIWGGWISAITVVALLMTVVLYLLKKPSLSLAKSYTAQQLGIYALEVITPISPGAPLCCASSDNPELDGLEISLKGGQMGPPNYFGQLQQGHA